MQDLDRFRPSGLSNTLCHVCGCYILVLGYGELCFIVKLDVCLMCWGCLRGVPLLTLYTREAGLHDGVLVDYGMGVLVSYNCTSSM